YSSGDLECKTSPSGGYTTIDAPQVTLKTIDTVFKVVSSRKKVTVAVRHGTVTVVGKHAKKAVVVAQNTRAGKKAVKEVVVVKGSDPGRTMTLSAKPDSKTVALEAKSPPPPPDTTPPVVKLRGRPHDPSYRPIVDFVFYSERGAVF